MNLGILLPELIALAGLIVLLVGELFVPDFSKRYSAKTAITGAFVLLAALLARSGVHGEAFGGAFQVNSFSVFFKVFFVLVIIPVLQMSREFFEDKLKHPGEFILILWTTLIGLLFLASANDFLLLFISLEIVTMSFYITASYLKRDLLSIEAGLKYLIIGSLASAFFVYGISLIYVIAGTLSLPHVMEVYAATPMSPLMIVSILFIITGIGFKVASVPFHLWVADVYEGAPAPVVAFLSVGSKAAGFVIALKTIFGVFITFQVERTILFSALAIMTITYGNLGALLQTNIKRLFGYSSISHAGYLLIGIAVGGVPGVNSILFYLVAYALSNLAAFLVINIVSKELGSDRIESYRGLSERSPVLAGVMLIALLSLAGIPPMAGFFGKFLILLSAVQLGLTWLALFGAVAVAVSLYYYLGLIRKMYIDESTHEDKIAVRGFSKGLAVFMAVAIIILGLYQGPMYEIIQNSSISLF